LRVAVGVVGLDDDGWAVGVFLPEDADVVKVAIFDAPLGVVAAVLVEALDCTGIVRVCVVCVWYVTVVVGRPAMVRVSVRTDVDICFAPVSPETI
jgi:hypothetical protein